MFIAYLDQGSGCDYTIGCGKVLIELQSKTREDAIEEIRANHLPHYGSEYRLENIALYEVVSKEVLPIQRWYLEVEENERRHGKVEKERLERQTYLDLKKKYEG